MLKPDERITAMCPAEPGTTVVLNRDPATRLRVVAWAALTDADGYAQVRPVALDGSGEGRPIEGQFAVLLPGEILPEPPEPTTESLILATLAREPGIPAALLASLTGLRRADVADALETLLADGRVRSERSGPGVRYYPAEGR